MVDQVISNFYLPEANYVIFRVNKITYFLLEAVRLKVLLHKKKVKTVNFSLFESKKSKNLSIIIFNLETFYSIFRESIKFINKTFINLTQ